MEIPPRKETTRGPAETFTGEVWLDTIYHPEPPRRGRINAVRFTPGARSAWHRHALGQTLYVTEGVGIVQPRGEEAVEIRAGDIVEIPAGEVHWHGAAARHYMCHLSITELPEDGRPEIDWQDHVTDEEYREAAG